MKIENIYNIFFSPTNKTKQILDLLVEQMGENANEIDLCVKKDSDKIKLNDKNLVFIAAPSHAGRAPKTFAERMKFIDGNGATAIIIATFGNRAQEDTLIELFDIANAQNFKVLAAASVVTQHSIIGDFGRSRPDQKDKMELMHFVENIESKIESDTFLQDVIDGNRPYKEICLIPMAPKIHKNLCIDCGDCAKLCPVDAINAETHMCEKEKCISCMRCVRICPSGARYIDEDRLEKLRLRLEEPCRGRKDNHFYL